MEYDYKYFIEHIAPTASIISVQTFPDGSYGNIRFLTVNSTSMEKQQEFYEKVGADAMYNVEVKEDLPYERYIPKDKNFEEFCYRSAILGETLHTYIKPERMSVWLYLTAIPLKSDKKDVGYCAYIQNVTEAPDYSLMANIAPDISANVLRICMKLRSSTDFTESINGVVSDIRELCGSEYCCILNTDFSQRKCSVLSEASNIENKKISMEPFINDDFFSVVDTWHNSIAGSTCIVIKDERDWAELKASNPVWYNSIKPIGLKNIILFPLKYHAETLGFIWAVNFDTEQTLKIKEMLELTTYYLSSEIASYHLFKKIETLSKKDVLTGVFNRNAMNNRIDYFVAGISDPDSPVCIIFADLNGLKHVNDTKGHFRGDLLLKDAALTMQKHFPDYEIYRAGGDEFMVIAIEPDKEAMAQKIEEFRKAASDPDGVCFAVGYSYGTIIDIRNTMHRADKNMYADKEAFYQDHPERKH